MTNNNDDEDFLSNFRIKSEEEIDDQNYWKKVEEWRSLPLLVCPNCKFKTVYRKSLDHHLRLTHKIT